MRQIHLTLLLKDDASEAAGFTLIESLVAMLMLLATLGGLIPVFMSYRLAAIDNQIKTGAIAVAQAELDDIRQTEFQFLPAGTSTQTQTDNVDFMGKTYRKVTTYCPAAGVTTCDADTKAIHVEVQYNSRQILEIETVFTNLE